MKQKIIGHYDLGGAECQLVLREGEGAEFYGRPEVGKCQRIKVGFGDGKDWSRVCAILTHETMELAMFRMGLRYGHTPDYSNDNGAYLFVMDHTQFSEVAARTGMFLAACLPDLSREWVKWKKK